MLVGLIAFEAAHPTLAAAQAGLLDKAADADVASVSGTPAPAPARPSPIPPGQRDLAGISGGAARAGAWNLSARAVADLMLTNNVALAPTEQEQSDLVLGLSLPLGLRRATARTLFAAEYVPVVYLYGRNSEADNVQNNLRSFMSVEAVDDYLFVDAIANMYPTYVSPFLPRPESGAFITSNRTQQTTLGVSPYIRHQTTRGWSYLLRNDSFWNGYSDSQLADSFANRFTATAESPPTRFNYGFDYTYLYTSDDLSHTAYYQQVGRVRPTVRVQRTLAVSARLGYETNDYQTPTYSGGVYGAGLAWTPNPRTRLDGFIEHRFFGASYGLNLDYRSRRTVWRLRGTRDTTTTIQQPLTQRPATTAELLDDAYSTEITDPTQRETLVRQFLDSAGLPPSLTQPYSFYTDQVYVSTQWTGSMVFLGRRNTLELALIWQVNDPPVTAGGATPTATSFGQLLQRGFRLSFSHRVSALSSVSVIGGRLYSKSTDTAGTVAANDGDSIQDGVQVALTRRLGRKTDGSVGLRWSSFDSTDSPYREVSALAALAYTF